MEAFASRATSHQQQAAALQAESTIKGQIAQQGAIAAQHAALEKLTNGPEAENVDPAQLVALKVPEHHQATVFKEIESAQHVAKNKAKMLQLFDQAAEDETSVKRLGGLLGQSASKKVLQGLMVSQIPIVDQTVRQYAAEAAFHSFLPGLGDKGSTVAMKRKGLEDWMTSNAKGTTAKGFGLDLNKFKSTRISPVPKIEHKAPKV